MSELTLTELKAMWLDELLGIEAAQRRIAEIRKSIDDLTVKENA